MKSDMDIDLGSFWFGLMTGLLIALVVMITVAVSIGRNKRGNQT
jgi:Mg2+/citrate symporter